MAIEDRVQALEDEIKVLKNEIQLTLLDIHEQILIHYYPTLRSSMGSDTAAERPPTANGHLASGRPNGHHQPANGHSTQNGHAADDSYSASAPLIGPAGDADEDDLEDEEVADFLVAAVPTSLAAIKATRTVTPPTDVARTVSPRSAQPDSGLPASERTVSPFYKERQAGSISYEQSADGWSAIPRLMAWVRQGIDAVGKSQTRQIIDMYAGGGFLAEELAGVLRQLVDLAPGEAAPPAASPAQVAIVMAGLNEAIAMSAEGVNGG